MAGGVAPVLETERLILREQRLGDFDRHAAMLADPLVYRFVGNMPTAREDAWRKLIGCCGLWNMLGYGYWSVELKSTGTYIGQVGFADFKREMQPTIEGIPEMGWILAPETHGQGLASEAVAAGLRWSDEALGGPEVTAIIDPGNAGSIRVAEKAGFTSRENATYKGEPILLFRRPAR
ncbi:MAG TPA: GNAT family N-acetyltransferase [Allosphingosinicella sp.]|uniref:GNAT family N-acetyltransferase n=1 Tax=Allosphingosinicella sp. TaxID=2823234 RepID=UPI002EDAF571